MTIVVLEDNILFSMPIQEIVAACGMSAWVVADHGQFESAVLGGGVSGVLLDMRLVVSGLLPLIPAGLPTAAFGPHVDGAAFLQLRQGGVREVWPNSKLREKLPVWLSRIGSLD